MKEVSMQDMRDYMIGSAIFAQGQPEDFYKSLTLIEDLEKKGLTPIMVDPKDVPDDAVLCQVTQRAGGGHPYETGELDRLLGRYRDAYEERDWNRYGRSLGQVSSEISKAISEEIYGYMTLCTSSSQGIVAMYASAMEGKPFIDGDCCGTAMTPHLDWVTEMDYRPIQVWVTPYGETLVVRDVPRDRAWSILETVHRISGYWFVAMAMGVGTFKNYKKAMVKNQSSKMIEVGAAVRKAREEGKNPVEAFMKAAPAHKLFEGEIESFTLQKTGGWAHGDFHIKGTDEFTGHTFRVWYSMENRISWLDGKQYVTIPDINGVVDSDTCECLCVLDHDHVRIVDGIYNGRKATVLGIAADKIWYELEGAIEAVNAQLKEYGFDIKHQPMEEVISAK